MVGSQKCIGKVISQSIFPKWKRVKDGFDIGINRACAHNLESAICPVALSTCNGKKYIYRKYAYILLALRKCDLLGIYLIIKPTRDILKLN